MARMFSRHAVSDTFAGRNGLTLVFLGLMLLSTLGHALSGWRVSNEDRREHAQPAEALSDYVRGDHFLATLFENWESEFLQMGLFVLLTAHLRQRGAAESRPLDAADEADKPPVPRALQPLPVRMGGLARHLYEHSLSGALLLLFAACFGGHLVTSWREHLAEQAQHGAASPESLLEYLGNAQFWFESLQNWQSEFLAVVALVVLSIFLREKDSTESKDVEAPHSQTGT